MVSARSSSYLLRWESRLCDPSLGAWRRGFIELVLGCLREALPCSDLCGGGALWLVLSPKECGSAGPQTSQGHCSAGEGVGSTGPWGAASTPSPRKPAPVVCCCSSNAEKHEVKNRKEVPSPFSPFLFLLLMLHIAKPNRRPASCKVG